MTSIPGPDRAGFVERAMEDISGLKTTTTHLETRIGAVEEQMVQGFRTINHTLDQMRRDSKAPIWQIASVLGGALTIVLVIVGMMQAGDNATDTRLERAITKFGDALLEHVSSEGHPTMMARATAFEERFGRMEQRTVHDLQQLNKTSEMRHETALLATEKLDVNLQREMRDLDARMQGEFGAQLSDLRGDVARINEVLNELNGERFNRDDFDKYVLPRLVEADARLRSIESTRSTAADRKAIVNSLADIRERLGIVEAKTRTPTAQK